MLKVIIIGAGPIGLYCSGRLKAANISHLLLEAGEKIGGQLSALYPEKEIVDLPGIESILAKDYITKLQKNIDVTHLKLNQQVIDIKNFEDHVEVLTKDDTYISEYVVIATGLGFYKPKQMGLPFENEFDNILYSLTSFEFLQNKKVAIFGGGDSALDWAKEISKVANDVFLIHRRREFRGNFDTIKDIKKIQIYTPYIPNQLLINQNKLNGVKIKHVEEETYHDLTTDYILVNFGNIPSPVVFNVPKQNTGIICDESRCVINRVYVAGDAIGVPGKIKRIGDGLKDADSILQLLFNL
ncbi:MAG: NAD(P)/FAD-dependent oxidoreductase [Bacilli bacterium]|nr:NAD(P)/FAD-dependent oxidoreductase [Bacilli bacterium]